ncbi:hydroxyethylthiazole kinase [Arcticibacter sp. MXS-1]|uniref:hydroxyethylthiazole kinase n=1 Tax=Arcticibacter sp. MXS-1 TaxID=3341726 RepID=UPI0035A86FDD
MKEKIWQQIVNVRSKAPLVHNITNYVVMNNTANALLACGASPVMAHAHPEVQDMVRIAGALVVNIGTLDEYWVNSMDLAIQQANQMGKPWVLDPVGAGATGYRNDVLKTFVSARPTVIRGNASEIMSVSEEQAGSTKGVDSTRQSDDALSAARLLAGKTGGVVCVSGATDLITDGSRLLRLSNGDPLMARVTGLGCSASAIIGAFLAAQPDDPYLACVAAMALLGIAGERAARKASGPGTLQVYLLDELYSLREDDFVMELKIEENAEG